MSYQDFQEIENTIWIEHMFDTMDIPFPPKSDYFKIAIEVEDFIAPKIKSDYPNIIETVKLLYKEGYTINTASGANSRLLNLYLNGMDIRECFTTLYGSDLINTMKVSKEYYMKIFTREALNPENVIIIDDSVKMLTMAKQLGANVIHSCVKGSKPEFDYFYLESKDLPRVISKF